MTKESFTKCRCTDDIVAYMYGELTAVKASLFESHLLSCTSCTDEFAAISNARYEVYEWKKLEFDSLPTPAITVPVRNEPATVGLIDKVRIAFEGGAVPSVAFAGLVIAVLAGGLLFSDNTASDVAAVNSNEVSRPVQLGDSEPIVEKPADTSRTGHLDPKRAAEPPQIAVASGRTPRGTSLQPSKGAARRVSEVKQSSARNRTVGAPAVRSQMRSVPTLNGFVDEEDTSLRLAQLFDDIDTRD